jgi:Ca2+-binding EF-hand superfamily protein
MNSISLTQVTVFVVAVCMASFFANADNALAHTTEDNAVVKAESSVSSAVVEEAAKLNDKFTFTSLDTDKNGKLSQQEVLIGKNEWLVESFKQIDSNADKSITEQELVDFVATATSK